MGVFLKGGGMNEKLMTRFSVSSFLKCFLFDTSNISFTIYLQMTIFGEN